MKTSIIALIIISLIFCQTYCSAYIQKARTIEVYDAKVIAHQKDVKEFNLLEAILKNGEIYTFSKDNPGLFKGNFIVGHASITTAKGAIQDLVKLPLQEVERVVVTYQEIDMARSSARTVGASILVVLGIIVTFFAYMIIFNPQGD
jgi:hypothetical protein